MGSLNVRNLPDATHQALRIQAARHGRSMEAEVRAILNQALNKQNVPGLGSMLATIGRDFQGVDLDTQRDTAPIEPATFD